MKKLMTLIGAAVMAFGLFADDPTPVVSYGTSFDANDPGVDGTTLTLSTAGFTGLTAETLTLSEYASAAEKYGYPTATVAGNTRRTDAFDSSSDNQYLGLETSKSEALTRVVANTDVFVDQLVKFTGFEDPQTNLVAGTKIAVWMSEYWNNEDTAATTNLYVTVGKVGAEGTEQVALKIDNPAGAEWEIGKWYRLTIKTLGNVMDTGYDARAGFIIYVDGKQVASSDPQALELVAKATLKDQATKDLMAAGKLFTAISTGATLASVGFNGTGSIDDLVLDDLGPAFARVPPTVAGTVTIPSGTQLVISNATEEIAHVGGVFQATPDSTVYFYFSPLSGYKMAPVVKEETVVANKTYTYSDIVANRVIATVSWNSNVYEATNVVDALTKVQEVEGSADTVVVEAKRDIDTQDVPGFGKLGLDEGAIITITPGKWAFTDAAATLVADIVAGATVTADDSDTFTYAGNVAGTNTAYEIAVASGETIKLIAGGEITTTTDLIDDIAVEDGYQLVAVTNTIEETDWYTYTSELIPAATYKATFTKGANTTSFKYVIDDVTNAYTEAITDLADGTAIKLVDFVCTAGYEYTGTTDFTINGADLSETLADATLIAVTEVTLSSYAETLKVGANVTLTAAALPSTALQTPVTWNSSNTEVATVVDGVVTAVAVGSANITATIGGVTSTACTITVESATVPVTGISLDVTDISVTNGHVFTLTATITPENATDKTITWSVLDDTIASVDATGVVTALKAGTTSVKAKANGGDSISEVCIVTVKANPGEPVPADPTTAAGTAEYMNNHKADYLTPPVGATVEFSTYSTYFTATPNQAGTQITFELNSTGAQMATNKANAASAQIAGILSTADTSVTITNPEPGFYYSLKQGTSVKDIPLDATQKNKLGGKDTISFEPNKSNAAGFYQIMVTPNPQ